MQSFCSRYLFYYAVFFHSLFSFFFIVIVKGFLALFFWIFFLKKVKLWIATTRNKDLLLCSYFMPFWLNKTFLRKWNCYREIIIWIIIKPNLWPCHKCLDQTAWYSIGSKRKKNIQILCYIDLKALIMFCFFHFVLPNFWKGQTIEFELPCKIYIYMQCNAMSFNSDFGRLNFKIFSTYLCVDSETTRVFRQ